MASLNDFESFDPDAPSDPLAGFESFDPGPAIDIDSLPSFSPQGDKTPLEGVEDTLSLFSASIRRGILGGMTGSFKEAAGRFSQELGTEPFPFFGPFPVSPVFSGAAYLAKKVVGKEAFDAPARELEETGRTQQISEAQRFAEELGPNPSFAREVVGVVGQSLPLSVAAIATAPFGGTPAVLGTMGLFTALDAENRAIAEGVPRGRAKLFGAIDGLIEAGTELLPMKALLKTGSPFATRLASFFAKEIPGELAATLLQDLNDKLLVHPEMSAQEFQQQLQHDLLLTAFATPISGGLQVGGVHLAQKGTQNAVEILRGRSQKERLLDPEHEAMMQTFLEEVERQYLTPPEGLGLTVKIAAKAPSDYLRQLPAANYELLDTKELAKQLEGQDATAAIAYLKDYESTTNPDERGKSEIAGLIAGIERATKGGEEFIPFGLKTYFHGTGARFQKFAKKNSEMGFHFGPSPEIAHARAEDTGVKLEDRRIIEGYLLLDNPLPTPNWAVFDPHTVARFIDDTYGTSLRTAIRQESNKLSKGPKGIVKPNEETGAYIPFSIVGGPLPESYSAKEYGIGWGIVTAWMDANGYDGFIYKNTFEATEIKEPSVAVLRPEQIVQIGDTQFHEKFTPNYVNGVYEEQRTLYEQAKAATAEIVNNDPNLSSIAKIGKVFKAIDAGKALGDPGAKLAAKLGVALPTKAPEKPAFAPANEVQTVTGTGEYASAPIKMLDDAGKKPDDMAHVYSSGQNAALEWLQEKFGDLYSVFYINKQGLSPDYLKEVNGFDEVGGKKVLTYQGSPGKATESVITLDELYNDETGWLVAYANHPLQQQEAFNEIPVQQPTKDIKAWITYQLSHGYNVTLDLGADGEFDVWGMDDYNLLGNEGPYGPPIISYDMLSQVPIGQGVLKANKPLDTMTLFGFANELVKALANGQNVYYVSKKLGNISIGSLNTQSDLLGEDGIVVAKFGKYTPNDVFIATLETGGTGKATTPPTGPALDAELKQLLAEPPPPPPPISEVGVPPPPSEPPRFASMGEAELEYRRNLTKLDKMNWFIRWTAGIEHLAKINAHIGGLQRYLNATRDWWRTKTAWTNRAEEILKNEWRQAVRRSETLDFDRYMVEVDKKSEELGRLLTTPEKQQIVIDHKLNLSNNAIAFAERVWGEYQAVLKAVEDQVIDEAIRTISDPITQAKKIAEYRNTFAKMKNRNYIPHSRFGKYAIFVKAIAVTDFDGRQYQPGETVLFQTFESERVRDKALEKVKRQFTQNQVILRGDYVIDDVVQMFQGLPQGVADIIAARMNLSSAQRVQLSEIQHELSPSSRFARHFDRRSGAPGYSMDVRRAFADYFLRFSNHIARITHNHELQTALKDIDDSIKTDFVFGEDATKRRQILEWSSEHYDYLNNPGNELANLRSLGFLYHLGFMPKSAFVNLTQIPLVSYPHLAAKYGDVETVAALAKAMALHGRYWKGTARYSPEVEQMLEEMKRRGITHQSAATEVGATSEGSTLQRLTAGRFLGDERIAASIRQFSEWGAFLFQAAEKVNRNVTAIAAFELSRKSGDSYYDAIEAAYDAVKATQYEYSRYNRPKMMRGKKSALFLFWQYMTNTLWFIGTDPGRWRYLALMLFLAGLQGVPGAENAMDLVDFFLTKSKEKLGWKDPKTSVRLEVKDLVRVLNETPYVDWLVPNNPDIVLHGLSRNLFGSGLDISGSVSMGRIIPGTEVLSSEVDTDRASAATLSNVSGAIGNIPLSLFHAFGSDEPGVWRQYEKVMPSIVRSISKGVRYATKGEETDPSGARLVEFEPDNWAHRMEIAGQTLGFPITRVQEEREKRYLASDVIKYYQSRRSTLFSEYHWSWKSRDQEAMAASREAILDFNKIVPHPALRIRSSDLSASLRARARTQEKKAKGVTLERRYQPLYKELTEGPGVSPNP